MQDSEKRCGQWGPFFVGDPVIYRNDIRWRVVAAKRKDVPRGYAPIEPEDDEIRSIVGTKMVSIDDLSRV